MIETKNKNKDKINDFKIFCFLCKLTKVLPTAKINSYSLEL